MAMGRARPLRNILQLFDGITEIARLINYGRLIVSGKDLYGRFPALFEDKVTHRRELQKECPLVMSQRPWRRARP